MTSSRIQNVLGSISKLLECAICLDLLKNPVITRCNHNFCRFCITEFLKNKKSVPCPLCKESVTKRSLQEQDRLNEIVTHVRGLVTAYQEDSGELFSPPRGPQVDSAFFPCTPEPIFSQEATNQYDPHRRQPKKNVKHSKKTHVIENPEEDDGDVDALGNDAEIHDPEEAHAGTSATKVRRSRQRGQETATRGNDVKQRSRSGTRSRSCTMSRLELEKEKALLQYLDEGPCGLIRNGEPEAGAVNGGSSAERLCEDEQNADHLSKERDRKRDQDGKMGSFGDADEVMEVDLDVHTVHENENCNVIVIENSIKIPSGRTGIRKDLSPICVMEKVTVGNMQYGQEKGRSTAKEGSSRTKDVLELTPECEYEGEECESGDDELLLFQSQEVKPKEKAPKVKLSIYSGKKIDLRSTRSNHTILNVPNAKQQYEVDNESMSSFDAPVNKGREFQTIGEFKTYSRSRVEKNKKNSMIKQWVQSAQETTGNHAFSESDSQTNDNGGILTKSTSIPAGHRALTTVGESEAELDAFGFSSLVESSKQDEVSQIRSEASGTPSQIPFQNRKKIFKTRITKDSRSDAVNKEADMPSSDPYEFKSSQTSQDNQNKKKQLKKRGRNAALGKKSAGKVQKDIPTQAKQNENSKAAMEKEDADQRDNIDDDVTAKEIRKKSKGKGKHVRFDLKSPEQEMSHLINKIGEAEDHDFLFSTQEALSNMPEQEEEEDVFQLDEEVVFQLDEEVEKDLETVTDGERSEVKTDDESQVRNSNVSDASGSDKSQSLTVVPPTPLLPSGPMDFMTKNKHKSKEPAPLTVVPQTPLIEAPEEVMSKDNSAMQNDNLQDDIHLTDSEACSQMPLPIPRKMKGGNKTKKKSLPVEFPVDASPNVGSGQSLISPTPRTELVKGKREANDTVTGHDDVACSGDSSSTEDLNITPDNTQFEEANLDLQPDEIRQRLSQMSQDSVTLNIEKSMEQVSQQTQHTKGGISRKHQNQGNQKGTLAHPEQEPCSGTKDSPSGLSHGENTKEEEVTAVGDTVGCGETTGMEVERKKSSSDFLDSVCKGAARDQSKSGGCDAEDIEEPSVDIIENTIESSYRSTRSCRSRGKQKKIGNESFGLKPRATKKVAKRNKVIEIEDSEEEEPAVSADARKPTTDGDMKTCVDIQKMSAVVDSQASTVPTSLQLESLQEDQTLPPDECIDELEDEEKVQDVVMESAAVDGSTEVPETVTESISLLDPQDEEDEDDAQVTSYKSQDASTLESVSILHNHEATTVVNGRSKQQKRKHSGEPALEPETPSLSDNKLQDSSNPKVSSAPVTINLDDSDDDMLVVRRPKRKCFSLDGSPLKARAKSARAKLTRKTKPSGRGRVAGDQQDQHKSGPESMDTENPIVSDEVHEGAKLMNNHKREDESNSLGASKKSLSTEQQSEDLQLINTIPEFSQAEQSLEDIFNKNSEMTCAAVPSDTEEVISNSTEVVRTDTSSLTGKDTDVAIIATPKQTSQKVKRSRFADSDSSDSDDTVRSTSVRRGVRAARGLASLKKKLGKSPGALSPKSPLTISSGSVVSETSSKKAKNNPQAEETNSESLSSGRKISLNDSECVGPTPINKSELVCDENKRKQISSKKSRGLTALVQFDSGCSDSDDADVTIIQSSGSGLSGKSQRNEIRPTESKKKKQRNIRKQINSVRDCHVGISPTVQEVQENLVDKEEDLESLKDVQCELGGSKKDGNTYTVYSSSDEEFVLRDDDEVIRKAEMPTVSDAYTELPQTSSPIQASCQGQEDSGDESDVAPVCNRKSSRPIITDSDSDDDSYHSDQQMNFTSSSAFSSQSDVLTTQQQGKLEKDMEEMRKKIRHLEALNTVAMETEGVVEVEECSKETPDIIPPSNKTRDEDESSSDGELFLSPLSPSPPPSITTTITENTLRPKDKKAQKVIEAFKIIDKFKSPDLSKTKKFVEDARGSRTRKDCEITSGSKLVGQTTERSPALSKKAGKISLKKIETIDSDESDLPLVKSPLGLERRIKKERSSLPDRATSSRKILSPLVFENRNKTNSKQIVLITSGLAGEQMKSVQEFLGMSGSNFFPKYNKSVTHVIVKQACDERDNVCDRTLKYFQGVVAKCWVVSFDWIRDSLLAGKPVPEDEYEMVGDTVSGENHHGPMRSRTSEKKLFSGFTFACIGVSREMTKDDMRVLVELGGADVAEDAWELGKMASTIPLIIRCLDFEERPNESEIETFNNFYKHYRLVTVSREWVLDSISSFSIQPLKDDYVVNTLKNLVLPF